MLSERECFSQSLQYNAKSLSVSKGLGCMLFNKDHHHYLTLFTSLVWLFWFSLTIIIKHEFALTTNMLRVSMAFLSPQSVAHHLFIYLCISCKYILSSFHALSLWSRLISLCSHLDQSPPFQKCPTLFQACQYFLVFVLFLVVFTQQHRPFFLFSIKTTWQTTWYILYIT